MRRLSPLPAAVIGAAVLTATQAAWALAPPNNSCTSATGVGNGQVSGSTSAATQDGSSSCTREAGTTAGDVWFLYTPPETGRVTFDTSGSGFDTLVSLHSGCPGSTANELACAVDGFQSQAVLAYDAVAGEPLLVRLSGAYGTSSGAFVLDIEPAGGISGRVISATTLGPIPGAKLNVFNSAVEWSPVLGAVTAVNGSYTIADLPPGLYYVTTSNRRNFFDELWDDVPCVGGWGCDKALFETPVTVTGGEVANGINFALQVGGSISGRVTDATTGAPLPSAYVLIQNQAGFYVAWTHPDATGHYLTTGLPSGQYRIMTSNGPGYVQELYEDVICPYYCDFTQATWIDVVLGQETAGVDIGLPQGGQITGVVTDEETGEGNVPGFIYLHDADGTYIGGAGANLPYTITSLPAGTYYLLVKPFDSYQAELYRDVPCPWGCDPTTGSPVVVTAGDTVTADFALPRGRNLSGTLYDEATGAPIERGSIEVYDSGGSLLGSTDVQNWKFEFAGAPYGTYYLRTRVDGYLDELYDDIPCSPTCDVTSGTPVVVSSATYPDARFDLLPSVIFADGFESGDVSAWSGVGAP